MKGSVVDAKGLLFQVGTARAALPVDHPVQGKIVATVQLVSQLLLQDAKRPEEGVRLQ